MKNLNYLKLVKLLVVLFCFFTGTNFGNISFAQQQPIATLARPPATLTQFQQGIVPRLVGLEYNENVISAYLDRFGFQFGEGIPMPNNDSIGLITFQSQEPNVQGDPDVPIIVHYAVEIPRYEIPDLSRIHFEEATRRIEEGSFLLGDVRGIPSDLPEEIVVRQSPQPFTIHEIGTRIDLFYSLGSVPSLLQLTVEEAQERIEPLQLRLRVDEKVFPSRPVGTIIDQQPKEGEPFPENRIINVTVVSPEPPLNSGNENVPPWVLWAGGIIVAAVLGGFVGKRIGKNNKKPIPEKNVDLKLKPVLDLGTQHIESDNNSLFNNHLHLKFIVDPGKQTLKTD